MELWLHNKDAAMTSTTQNYIVHKLAPKLALNYYRMRDALSDYISTLVFTQLGITQIDEEPGLQYDTNFRAALTTIAMPRGEEANVNFTYNAIQAALGNWSMYKYPLVIINTNTNPSLAEETIKWLVDTKKYTDLNLRAALTINPFHKVSTLYKLDTAKNITKVLVFTNVLTNEFLLNLGAVIPKLYNKPIYEDIANALLTKDKKIFNKAVDKTLEKLTAWEKHKAIVENITAYVSDMYKSEESDLISNISNTRRYINDFLADLNTYYKKLNEDMLKLTALKLSSNNETSNEFVEYLTKYKSDVITNASRYQSRLLLTLKLSLSYFNTDLFKPYITSTRPNIYRSASESIKKLLKDLFIDNKYTLIIEQGIYIDLVNAKVSNDTSHSNANSNLIGFPNPHMYYYNCWGNNEPLIIKALRGKNYIEAFEQICAAVSGINFTDTAVMNRFVDMLAHPNLSVIPALRNNETKELISVKQYVERMALNETTENNG